MKTAEGKLFFCAMLSLCFLVASAALLSHTMTRYLRNKEEAPSQKVSTILGDPKPSDVAKVSMADPAAEREKKEKLIKRALRYLDHPNRDIRRQAVWDMRWMPAGFEDAVDPLINAMQDSDYVVRYGAAQALGRIRSDRAIPIFVEKLKEKSTDRMMTFYAMRALKLVAPQAPQAVPYLKDNLDDPEFEFAQLSARLLKKIGTPEALEILNTPRNQRLVSYQTAFR